jgi:hypothetical protein
MTFKDGVPAYRVRLRRDFVEVLLSAPEETPKKATVAKAAPKAGTKLASDVSAKSIPAVKPGAAKK